MKNIILLLEYKKSCIFCKKTKTFLDFWYSQDTKDNLMYHCKECWYKNYKKNEKEIKERIKEQEIEKLNQPKEREPKEGEIDDLVDIFWKNENMYRHRNPLGKNGR